MVDCGIFSCACYWIFRFRLLHTKHFPFDADDTRGSRLLTCSRFLIFTSIVIFAFGERVFFLTTTEHDKHHDHDQDWQAVIIPVEEVSLFFFLPGSFKFCGLTSLKGSGTGFPFASIGCQQLYVSLPMGYRKHRIRPFVDKQRLRTAGTRFLLAFRALNFFEFQ